jgi:hypothetical protein
MHREKVVRPLETAQGFLASGGLIEICGIMRAMAIICMIECICFKGTVVTETAIHSLCH